MAWDNSETSSFDKVDVIRRNRSRDFAERKGTSCGATVGVASFENNEIVGLDPECAVTAVRLQIGFVRKSFCDKNRLDDILMHILFNRISNDKQSAII